MTETRKMIGVTDAASMLGVSTDTIYRMMKLGQFVDVYKLPTGTIRFYLDDVEFWIGNCRESHGCVW